MQCICVRAKSLQSCATVWTVALQALLSMGFSRKEYWSGLSYSPPGDLPNPGIKPMSLTSPHWQAASLPPAPPRKPNAMHTVLIYSLETSQVRVSQGLYIMLRQAEMTRQGEPRGLHSPWSSWSWGVGSHPGTRLSLSQKIHLGFNKHISGSVQQTYNTQDQDGFR